MNHHSEPKTSGMNRWASFWVGLLLLGACDRVAGPPPSRDPTVANLSESSSSDETTITVPTDAHDLNFSGAIGSYPSATIVEISMQGSSISGYKYSSAGQGDYWTDIGLAGVNVGGACHGGVVVHFSASASYRYGPRYEKACPSADSVDLTLNWSTIRRISGNGLVLRSDLISDSCGGPCRKYEGGDQTVTVRRMPAELKLTPLQALISPGQSVTFTASADPSSTNNIVTPFSGLSWSWQPDGGIATAVCSSRTTCAPPAGISGSLAATAMVNGLVKTRDARVEVKTDQLQISASKSTVKPGEEVVFTATTQNGTGFTVQTWQWRSNTGAPGLTTSGQGCGNSKTCKIRVYEDGYMEVTGVVQGMSLPQKATASVDVVPCPPSGAGASSPMEVDAIRKQMLDALALSRLAPFSERGGDIWLNPTTGEHHLREIPNALGSNSCRYQPDYSQAPPVPPGFTVEVGIWHTHPQTMGDSTINCWEYDDKGLKVPKVGTVGQGPSWGDWSAVVGGTNGLEGLIVDGKTDFWQYNVPVDKYYDFYEFRDPYRYKKDGDSICYGGQDQPLKPK